MNLPHLHLLLNHVPTVGTLIAVALLVMSLLRRNDGLKRISLELFCVIGLLTLPAYLSGLASQAGLEELGASAELIQRHHDAAFQASILMLATGFVAWLGLWRARRGVPSALNVPAVLVLSVVTVVLMGRAATMGGEIRHPEIVAENAGAVVLDKGWFAASTWATIVNDKVWLFPAMEALHFIGLWVLFGVLLVVNLRMLGMLRPVAFPAVHRLLPWAALALTVNIVTGMLFVVSNPSMYLLSSPFYWKIGLLLLAGATLLYQTTFDGVWRVESGDAPPARVKAAGLASILLWFGVLYFGRMLPFIGDSF